jgi:3,4-dihydroxy 2-butanone 4-phosphate synthase/GTP cyclohydrolase II
MDKQSLLAALEDFKQGKMVIVVDDEDRENEGDFVLAAEKATPELINFMAKFGRGIICTPITKSRAHELQLELMVKKGDSLHDTAFTVSVDSVACDTGVSAVDRYLTIKDIIDPSIKPEKLLRPGHIFPLIARDGGVLERPGHTEAAVEMCRLAGLYPAGVICEIMKEDGTMARYPDLVEMAKQWDMKIIAIKDLIEHVRELKGNALFPSETIELPTAYGQFKMALFERAEDHHLAIFKGELSGDDPVLCRVHYECLTGDVFSSQRCDCGEQLNLALENLAKVDRGVILYLRQEGRGIGLPNKIKAYKLQEQGHDTVSANHQLGFDADLRDFDLGARMLQGLGVKAVRMLTNNPKKIEALQRNKIEVVERLPIKTLPNDSNFKYLKTKEQRLGHILDLSH